MEFASPAAPDDKKLNIPTLRDDEWLILYPEKSKPTEDDIEKIKETQRDESNKKKAPAVKFVPIKGPAAYPVAAGPFGNVMCCYFYLRSKQETGKVKEKKKRPVSIEKHE